MNERLVVAYLLLAALVAAAGYLLLRWRRYAACERRRLGGRERHKH
ncbi:hypothetical protein [Sphingomonas sp. IW22]